MVSGCYRFDRFLLDPADRRLSRDGEPVELNARYLDALALLVSEEGRLVSKNRFLDEVWRGVPVTDEALTQCIKTLRQRLGDDSANPRFIETVPKHGYRFIADTETAGEEAPAAPKLQRNWREPALLGLAGTLGGGLAGILGGLFYGFAVASQQPQPGMGAVSVLLVILCVTVLMALLGAAGVAFGIAAAAYLSSRLGRWLVAGGLAGGFIVGAGVKLVGLDAFALLIGGSPGDITGPLEGLILGAGVGAGAWLSSRISNGVSIRRSVAAASLAGAASGCTVVLLGGRMLGGSLHQLAEKFPESRLRFDQIGRLFGEQGFGPVTRMVTSVLEGALFAACVVGAMALALRSLEEHGPTR